MRLLLAQLSQIAESALCCVAGLMFYVVGIIMMIWGQLSDRSGGFIQYPGQFRTLSRAARRPTVSVWFVCSLPVALVPFLCAAACAVHLSLLVSASFVALVDFVGCVGSALSMRFQRCVASCAMCSQMLAM